MNLGEIKAVARQRLDDMELPYLYAEPVLTGFAAEAESEAAVRARLLSDSTSKFCNIQIVAGQQAYRLDPRIWFIDSASLQLAAGGRSYDIDVTGLDSIQRDHDWRTRNGRPCHLVHGRREVRIFPTPRAEHVGILNLAVYRTPLFPLQDDGDEPEIPPEHHLNLVDWIIYRAMSSFDTELASPADAAAAELRFSANFGARDSADVMRRHRERRPASAPYGGY